MELGLLSPSPPRQQETLDVTRVHAVSALAARWSRPVRRRKFGMLKVFGLAGGGERHAISRVAFPWLVLTEFAYCQKVCYLC